MMMNAYRKIFNEVRAMGTRQICSLPSVGINGFGRIGKSLLRLAVNNCNVNVVAVNEPHADVNAVARSLRHDTVHGTFPSRVTVHDDCIQIDGKTVKVFHEKNAEDIKWCSVGVDYVIDSTGKFTEKNQAEKHLSGGAKKVIISGLSKDAPMFVKGVNFDHYKKDMSVVSNASSTTNCAALLIKMIHDKFGVENCLLTTTHAMTTTQSVHDGLLNRSAFNIIPNATDSAKAVGLVIPELKGKVDGDSTRVPTLNVSLLKLYMNIKEDVNCEAIKCEIFKNSQCCHKGLISYYDKPEKFVSSDFIGNTHSAIVDFSQIDSIGRLVTIGAWYDNEMAYSSRLFDLVQHMVNVDQSTCN